MELRELCKLERTMEGIVNSTNTIFLITNLKSIVLSCFSSVWPFASPWTETHQTSLSMGFSRQEYWSGLPFPLLGDLPNLGLEPTSPGSPALAGRFFTTEPSGKPWPPKPLLLTIAFTASRLRGKKPSEVAAMPETIWDVSTRTHKQTKTTKLEKGQH